MIVNNGKGTQPNTERNEELKRDYLSKEFDTAALISKYQISPKRIYDILKSLGITPVKRLKSNTKRKTKNK